MEKATKTVKVREKKNPVFLIILCLLIIFGAWFGISKYTYAQHHEGTDDAQVSADISPVIPRVAGYVKEVRAKDNQLVKEGDTLLLLDDRDYQIKLKEAEAALAAAQSNLNSAKATTNASRANIATSAASIGTVDAQIEAAKINVWRTTQDYERYANLIKDHSITQQQYEQALAAKQTAERQLQILQEQRKQAAQQTNAVTAQSGATSQQIGMANAAIRQRQVERIRRGGVVRGYHVARRDLFRTILVDRADGARYVGAGRRGVAGFHENDGSDHDHTQCNQKTG